MNYGMRFKKLCKELLYIQYQIPAPSRLIKLCRNDPAITLAFWSLILPQGLCTGVPYTCDVSSPSITPFALHGCHISWFRVQLRCPRTSPSNSAWTHLSHAVMLHHLFPSWCLSLIVYLFIWLLQVIVAACGIQFPDQGSNPGPSHWELGVLATRPPWKSRVYHSEIILYSLCFPQGSANYGPWVKYGTKPVPEMQFYQNEPLPFTDRSFIELSSCKTWLDSITDSTDMNFSKLGDSEGQGSLACCRPWGRKKSDMTQQLNNNKELRAYRA